MYDVTGMSDEHSDNKDMSCIQDNHIVFIMEVNLNIVYIIVQINITIFFKIMLELDIKHYKSTIL